LVANGKGQFKSDVFSGENFLLQCRSHMILGAKANGYLSVLSMVLKNS
jgi:hypothetical protein